MSIYKRGKVYWYNFVWKDQHVQSSTKQGNPRVARQMEAAHRTRLAKGEVGIEERPQAPTLKDFAQRFREEVRTRNAAHPLTVTFYESKLDRLLSYPQLAKARLDQITEDLISTYVQQRRKAVSAATTNRELATLRKLLRLAHEWRLLERVPRIRLLAGERVREFVLSYPQERLYLEMAPQPLHDVATLLLDTGLRIGECLGLEWDDVHLTPAEGAQFGYLVVRGTKSRKAKRTLSLTSRAQTLLEKRLRGCAWVFTNEPGDGPLSVYTVEDQHSKLRSLLKLPEDFVPHSLRHTFLTRLGATNTDAFTLMKIAGHSTVTISQRYVHPTPETMEAAFARLEALNAKGAATPVSRSGTDERAVTTVLTTVPTPSPRKVT
jgi:integrase